MLVEADLRSLIRSILPWVYPTWKGLRLGHCVLPIRAQIATEIVSDSRLPGRVGKSGPLQGIDLAVLVTTQRGTSCKKGFHE